MRHAVITGAAGGIGQALVRVFAAAGYKVIATDCMRRPTGLPCTDYIEADLHQSVLDEGYADTLFQRIRAQLPSGGLHALVNNAALQRLGGVDDLTRDDWQRSLNVNVLAPFLWAQALLPALECGQGSIVNISSIHARLTKRNFVAYASSKAALSGMTRAMAVDLGSRVRVNAIEPAAIGTEMLKAGFDGKPELFAQLEQCHPAGRIGRPEEVAACALALVAGDMRFMHGACIALDGGIGARLFDPD
jgi:NAD(P)-dependent dehydrogenase (short-subunit alcohol dehydrogenase family)